MVRAAEQADVPIELLAPRKRLEALLKNSRPAGDALAVFTTGWRGQVLAPVLPDVRALLEQQDNHD